MDKAKLEHALKLRETGRVEEALHIYRTLEAATEDRSEKASLLLNQSTCFAILGLTAQARERFNTALETAGSVEWLNTFFKFQDACLLSQEGEWVKALNEFENLLRTESAALKEYDLYDDVQERRAFMLVKVERYGEALPILKKALAATKNVHGRALILCNLGAASENLKLPAEAEDHFLEALRIGVPKDWEGYVQFALGRIWHTVGSFHEAKQRFEKCLERACELGLSVSPIYEWLAATCRSLGDFEAAQRYSALAKPN